MTAPECTTCNQTSRLTTGKEVYPHRPDLYAKSIYVCDGCNGRVGCHPDTTTALGTPANGALRKERSATHALIDPIWRHSSKSPCYERGMSRKSIKGIQRKARTRVYSFMAEKMGLRDDQAHIGMFDIEQCQVARAAFHGVSYDDIRLWDRDQKRVAA